MGSLYTQENLGIPTGKNRVGSDQGSWLAVTRDVECCARSRAGQSTPRWAWWSHVRYAGWPPSCWNHWMTWVPAHLRCLTVTNLLKIRRYRSPVTVWVRPCPSSDRKGPITPELLTAHHAVHLRLCRGPSLTRSGVVVVQNRLFWVLTLPSSSKLLLSKGYGTGRQVKLNNLHFFLFATHTHDHDWNWLKHPTYQIIFSRASIWHVQQYWQLSHFNTKSI